jgi:hypothetical protein
VRRGRGGERRGEARRGEERREGGDMDMNGMEEAFRTGCYDGYKIPYSMFIAVL